METPVFDFVPLFGGSTAKIRSVVVRGVSTRHGDTKTDRGRLYARVAFSTPTYTVSLHSDRTRSTESKVAEGTTSAVGSFFDLAAVAGSGITAQMSIASYSADDASIVLVVSFAVDPDVFSVQRFAAHMPGYDNKIGLANFHARAMREIMTSALPRSLPHLYPGGTGLSSFVPDDATVALPDLSKIASADQLRSAQAALTRALAASEAAHLAEFAEIENTARTRFAELMTEVAEANTKETDENEQTDASGSVATSTWIRG